MSSAKLTRGPGRRLRMHKSKLSTPARRGGVYPNLQRLLGNVTVKCSGAMVMWEKIRNFAEN